MQGLEQGLASSLQRETLLGQERDRETELCRALDTAKRELEMRLAKTQSELVCFNNEKDVQNMENLSDYAFVTNDSYPS